MLRRDLLKIFSAAFLSRALVAQPSFAQSSAVKTGNIGMNLAGATYYSSEMPFANLASLASRWRVQKYNEPFTWDLPLPPMSAEDYPLSVPAGAYLETALISTRSRKSLGRELVLTYDGEGTLEYGGSAKLLKRSPGVDHIKIMLTDDSIMAQLKSTNANNPLRNVSLREVDGAAANQTFRPAFLKRCAPMSTLRYMDWMSTNGSKIENFEQRPGRNRFTQSENGVALEYMIELSNTLKIAPWFTLPHRATDDYVQRFAEMVKQDLDPALPVYVEYSNEVWNGQFEQSRYAQEQGVNLGLSSDAFEAQLRYYSQRTTEILRIWERVFGNDKGRVLGVYASQSANDWTGETILSWGDAAQYADVHAIAPYFGGQFGPPETADDVAGWSLDRLFGELEKEVEGPNKAMMSTQAALARKFGVTMVAYEGGQHLAGYWGAENNDRLTALFKNANADARMGDLYRKYLANWTSVGGGTFVLYNSMGDHSKWGSWGLLENEDQTSSPKWDVVQGLLKA